MDSIEFARKFDEVKSAHENNSLYDNSYFPELIWFYQEFMLR